MVHDKKCMKDVSLTIRVIQQNSSYVTSFFSVFSTTQIFFKARLKVWTTHGVQNILGYSPSIKVPAVFITLALLVMTWTTFLYLISFIASFNNPALKCLSLYSLDPSITFINTGPLSDVAIILKRGLLCGFDHP
ncbi:hypothetical protein ACB092_08G045400 [Castanea dentata]